MSSFNKLYFQPAPSRVNDDALPTAPDSGLNVGSIIDELTRRVEQSAKRIDQMVDSRALAKIILTDRDIVLMGDQVSIVGQVNIVDWIRDVSGNPTGGIDRSSITRIVGGRIQTGIIESVNWSTTTGSQINLDAGTIVLGGSSLPKFSVNTLGQLSCVDASVRGTLTAGSIIAGSVTINDELGPTLDELAAGTDIQGALSAGVTNILAGIGTDFRLEVDTTNSLITMRHKDAVFFGTAPAGSNKPGLGISASGVGMGYNRASDGAWVSSVAIDASGNVAILGTLTAGSVIASSVTVGGVPLSTISSNAAQGASIYDDLRVSGTVVLKGVLVPTDAGALKTGSITWNSTTGALTGGTGMAMTEFGLIGAASGSATLTFNASTGALTIKGNITGGSNIDITGNGYFNGATVQGPGAAAVVANNSLTADWGVLAYGSGAGWAGVRGINNSTSGIGLEGIASSSTGFGVIATNPTGVGLKCDGKMTITSSTLVTNLNADMVDGFHAGALCNIVPCNTGTCTVAGNGFNLNVTGTLASSVRTRGTSNFAYIENISDRRLKQDVVDEINGLSFILSLRPRNFRMISDPSKLCHGFIAQEVNELISQDDNLAIENSDGTWGFDYNGISSPIVKSIQELYTMVESQGKFIELLLTKLENNNA